MLRAEQHRRVLALQVGEGWRGWVTRAGPTGPCKKGHKTMLIWLYVAALAACVGLVILEARRARRED